MTGKKTEVTARTIARRAAVVSFFANEVTNVGLECGRLGRTTEAFRPQFYFTI
jgi:hypothetical protein